VGQGLFFTGLFEHLVTGKKFSLVYDCGFHNQSTYSQFIDYEISDFHQDLNGEQIDVLIISHFHSDHVNKIGSLLNKCNGAKTVFLPYINEDEKYLYLMDNLINGNQGDNDTLESFINDPVSFLLERNVEKICFIHHNDSNDSSGSGPDFIKDNPDFFREIENNTFDFGFELNINLLENTEIETSNDKVEHFFDDGNVSINQFWQFKFFNKKLDYSKLLDLKSQLKSLLNTKIEPNYKTVSKQLKQNHVSIEQIKQSYYSVFSPSEINDTSLLVLNTPIYFPKVEILICNCQRNQIHHWHRRYLCCRNSFQTRNRSINNSFLLTGDIKLNDDCIDQIKIKWDDKNLNNIFMIQIPHHGAGNSINNYALSSFRNLEYGVINYGLGNIFKHPHQNIIALLVNQTRRIRIKSSTQVEGLRFIYFLGKRLN
jgi:hypothetical protein